MKKMYYYKYYQNENLSPNISKKEVNLKTDDIFENKVEIQKEKNEIEIIRHSEIPKSTKNIELIIIPKTNTFPLEDHNKKEKIELFSNVHKETFRTITLDPTSSFVPINPKTQMKFKEIPWKGLFTNLGAISMYLL